MQELLQEVNMFMMTKMINTLDIIVVKYINSDIYRIVGNLERKEAVLWKLIIWKEEKTPWVKKQRACGNTKSVSNREYIQLL